MHLESRYLRFCEPTHVVFDRLRIELRLNRCSFRAFFYSSIRHNEIIF